MLFVPHKNHNTGKWHPFAKTVGTFTTKELIRELSEKTTVNASAITAVLMSLPNIMSLMMSKGFTVKLDGLGTFYLTPDSMGNGVETAEEVSSEQINGSRIRFNPERSTGKNKPTTRTLMNHDVEWKLWGGSSKKSAATQGGSTGGTGGSTGGNSGSGEGDDDMS